MIKSSADFGLVVCLVDCVSVLSKRSFAHPQLRFALSAQPSLKRSQFFTIGNCVKGSSEPISAIYFLLIFNVIEGLQYVRVYYQNVFTDNWVSAVMKNTTRSIVLGIAVFMAGTAHAENVEIYLLDMLDNTQAGYCIDIAKGKEEAANPEDGLQGHTCYSPGGALGYDQTFDTEKFDDGQLYMVNFDVCTQISSTEAGSALELAACDGNEVQSFQFSTEGTIVPASAPDMCITVAEDTRSGRSDANQIKVLSLEACEDSQAAYQTWGVRTVN